MPIEKKEEVFGFVLTSIWISLDFYPSLRSRTSLEVKSRLIFVKSKLRFVKSKRIFSRRKRVSGDYSPGTEYHPPPV